MTATVASLWRHPIKSHGREALERVVLSPGQGVPWDRAWAVAHEASTADGTEWVPCANFTRVAKAPRLQAIDSRYDEGTGRMTLSHPDRPDLDIDPDRDRAAFLDWVHPLMPEGRAAPARLVRAQTRAMTDSAFASVAVANLASHRVVAGRLDRPDLSIHRWRANVWLDGLGPWEEFEWIGRCVRIGTAVLTVRERTGRCLATAASPQTGRRDADTLGALERDGHTDFAVYAEVTEGGTVAVGDVATLT
ncbi:MOSC domain-containing protein [Rhodobacteraceae bacterium CCMM004]|nr:MOSC domain-containing protein [Rhodobacteraceae bacterium CCMM004]